MRSLMVFGMLRRITYTSIATVTLDQRALLALLHAARGFNEIYVSPGF